MTRTSARDQLQSAAAQARNPVVEDRDEAPEAGAPASEAPAQGEVNTAVSQRSVGAISLHIGVNSVDPTAYGGWSGALTGCETDARSMASIANAEGFTVNSLLTRQATSARVLAAIQSAADSLASGSTFFLTYAGHGAQVPNLNNDGDEEVDAKDETWVLWDRMLLDDELRRAFSAFASGVRIVLLSDSCHSGTLYRRHDSIQQIRDAASKRDFYRNLVTGATEGAGAVPRPGPMDGSANGGTRVMTRELPYEVNALVLINNLEQYRRLQAGSRSAGGIAASGVSISGCADNQLSQEIGGAGVFSTRVRTTWAQNGFSGSYRQFHREILSQMLPNQTPQMGLFGTNPQQLVEMTPFNP